MKTSVIITLFLFIFTLSCTKTIVETKIVTVTETDTIYVQPVSHCSKDHWGYVLITLDVDQKGKYYSNLSFRRDSFQGMWDHLANYTTAGKEYLLYRNVPSGSFTINLYQSFYPIVKQYWWYGPTDGPSTRISWRATVLVADCDTARIDVHGGM